MKAALPRPAEWTRAAAMHLALAVCSVSSPLRSNCGRKDKTGFFFFHPRIEIVCRVVYSLPPVRLLMTRNISQPSGFCVRICCQAVWVGLWKCFEQSLFNTINQDVQGYLVWITPFVILMAFQLKNTTKTGFCWEYNLRWRWNDHSLTFRFLDFNIKVLSYEYLLTCFYVSKVLPLLLPLPFTHYDVKKPRNILSRVLLPPLRNQISLCRVFWFYSEHRQKTNIFFFSYSLKDLFILWDWSTGVRNQKYRIVFGVMQDPQLLFFSGQFIIMWQPLLLMWSPAPHEILNSTVRNICHELCLHEWGQYDCTLRKCSTHSNPSFEWSEVS